MLRNFLVCIIMVLAVGFSQSDYVSKGDVRFAPQMLNYQGYLADTLGSPITNPSLSMTFTIFDASVFGNQKWTEDQVVSVNKGIFHVLLGDEVSIPDSVFANSPYRYLELTIGGQILTPRTQIVSAGYAYIATYSDTAQYALNAAADNDWSFRITDGADTTLQTGGRWGLARAGNVLYGIYDSTHVNFGVACTTGSSGLNNLYCTVGGGWTHTVSGSGATVAGGIRNTASGSSATVAGGRFNTASVSYATVGGGQDNTASGYSATVAGGNNNFASGTYATVGGGQDNAATDDHATVGGGEENTVSSYYATVGGGHYNFASGSSATVAGGAYNFASSSSATVAGGASNYASGLQATVGGGCGNCASGTRATVGGGLYNYATDSLAYIGGGDSNAVAGKYSAILGGYADTITATGDYSFLFGINSNLTQDSTFMVDMPHVWFGKESNGYEFPVTDGSNGQVLMTNGAGQVSWSTAAGGSNQWTFRITDGADTTLQMGGRWGLARAGNMLYGIYDSTHVNLGVACTTGSSGSNFKYCTVSGGIGNKALYRWATVGGGDRNTASYEWATVGGGESNIAISTGATVAGGRNNTAGEYGLGEYTTVGGGYLNSAVGALAVVGGGYSNYASGPYSVVGGGYNHEAWGQYAVVGGGYSNTSSGDYPTVGGGRFNTAGGYSVAVGGGEYNTSADSFVYIGGGYRNYAAGKYAAILGGYADTIFATGDYSYLFGINSNLAQDSTFMVDMPHVWFGTEAAGYEFPKQRGAGGQVLGTNASGQLSWVTVAADTDWVITGSNMYSGVSGNVGIGVTNPTHPLHVETSVSMYLTGIGHFVNTETINDGCGVYGACSNSDGNGCGGWFKGGQIGVRGTVTPNGGTSYYGVEGVCDGNSGWGINHGVYARCEGGGNNYGLYAYAHGSGDNFAVYGLAENGSTNWAGYFDGDAYVDNYLAIKTSSPTSALDIAGDNGYDQLRMRTAYTPSSSSDPNGNTGDVAWDDTYIYIKTDGGWKRTALSMW